MTMKAHTYYIIFGRPPIRGKLPAFPPGGATGSEYTCTDRRLAHPPGGGEEGDGAGGRQNPQILKHGHTDGTE